MLEPGYVRFKYSIVTAEPIQWPFETWKAAEDRVGLPEGVTQRKSLRLRQYLIDFEHRIVHRGRHAAGRRVIPKYSRALWRGKRLQNCITDRIDDRPAARQ